MKRIVTLLVICLVAFSCKHAFKDNSVVKNVPDFSKEAIFKSHKLQDSLDNFILSVESFTITNNIQVEYMIKFSLKGNDTTLTMFACTEFTPASQMASKDKVIGGIFYKNRAIMLRLNTNIDNIDYIIDRQSVCESVGMHIDSIGISYKNIWDIPQFLIYKEYLFRSPDSLKLIDAYAPTQKQRALP